MDAAAHEVYLLDRSLAGRQRVDDMALIERDAVIDRARDRADTLGRRETALAEPRRDCGRHVRRAQEPRIVWIEHEGERQGLRRGAV